MYAPTKNELESLKMIWNNKTSEYSNWIIFAKLWNDSPEQWKFFIWGIEVLPESFSELSDLIHILPEDKIIKVIDEMIDRMLENEYSTYRIESLQELKKVLYPLTQK